MIRTATRQCRVNRCLYSGFADIASFYGNDSVAFIVFQEGGCGLCNMHLDIGNIRFTEGRIQLVGIRVPYRGKCIGIIFRCRIIVRAYPTDGNRPFLVLAVQIYAQACREAKLCLRHFVFKLDLGERISAFFIILDKSGNVIWQNKFFTLGGRTTRFMV